MPKLTLKDLLDRVDSAIKKDENMIYDVAAESGSIVGNVKHMRWFKCAVADWLVANTDRWSHLQREVNDYR